MKKFLVILMVVAMASFLFVGCMPGGVTPPDVDDEEDEDVGVKTDTPYITDAGSVAILATTTQYVKDIKTLLVDGVGVAGAIIKLYIDDVYAGIGSTGTDGTFDNIAVTGATVTEGVNKFYVTATVPGLAESDKSTEYTFTYDKTKPTILSVAGDSSDGYITVTFSEPVAAAGVVSATWMYGAAVTIIAPDVTVTKVVTPTSGTARLYEVTLTDLLPTKPFLSVSCAEGATAADVPTDLAGNLMVTPVTVTGSVTKN